MWLEIQKSLPNCKHLFITTFDSTVDHQTMHGIIRQGGLGAHELLGYARNC